ncbi:hypothetical protein A3D00_01880 [Candidatus Woesebacteria bacterium RIFCSPHIGHO2_02_FULL_38_9]|uniref:Uncharacterized protein n=1 Tax=Candidatus Woesebacteria bacterium RIFCSPHIGHO2_01_FULL_39_28 TaxID=1802496 RepID=A0A1F7YI71_9BACT|nr:MAG: hypothetical protein A2627_02440 [Candidatus Woesebacteria bacterium RIFCSPHIGHO2_01_FULL_39_28]OGM32200.1 MAG: hypothetical protein A3D00_01880 [Candidatus Woesebacteria bacterium RIFCSPHIGHO2_02_FULL_38_9]OGM57186.1 MAG: hypothetical protein A3A50_03300 [Candidatus Woesebacteria bacterium RIFCSPLOWO2_01_FULL_38_20]
MPVSTGKTEPPLVDLKVTNPVTYIKRWWSKIIGNEGMEFRFRIHPLTTIAIAFVVTSLTLGIGKFALSATIPFLKYEKLEGILVTDTPKIPTITPDPWRETAFTGTLQYSGPIQKYYLITTSSEAIALEVPVNIDLKDTVGKRIFAAGNYNKITRTLVVASASDLEVLPKKPSPFPTVIPTPTLFETTTPNTSPTYIP